MLSERVGVSFAGADTYDLLDLVVGRENSESGETERFNLATLCVWHNQVKLLHILAEKTPPLLWQRFIDDEELMPLVTPLDAALLCRDASLFIALLHSLSLTEHSQCRPLEYAALIDRCYALWKKWVTSDEDKEAEALITKSLLQVAASTLFTEIATETLTKTVENLYREALPLQSYHGAPDCIKHMDFMLTIDSGEILREGGCLDTISQALIDEAREFICFMKNPELCPIYGFNLEDHLNLRATHLSLTIKSTSDAEQTTLYLRFIRLDAVIGPYCA